MTPALLVLAAVTVIACFLAWRSWQPLAAHLASELQQRRQLDTLTGLPNRRALDDLLDPLLAEARRNNARVAVLAVGLRGLGHLDDTYGHEVADALLTAAARQLRSSLRPEDVLVRVGGPRFVAACADVTDPDQAVQRATSLLAAVQRTYEVGADRLRLRASAGVTLTDQATTSVDDVLLDANVALDRALDEGQGAVQLFDHTMRSTRTPSTTEHQLREALDRGEFWLLYQPVVSLADSRIVGVEALLRWADPDRGLENPASFLPTLDDTGLIVPVGGWVLDEAARQSRAWQDDLPDLELTTTVNVSPRQLAQSDFVDSIRAALDGSGVEPGRLCIEIAEGPVVQEPEEVWATLRRVKELGCQLALDDFGAGYTSLQHLRQFRLDTLKIARVFVAGVATRDEDAAIVEHVIGLTRALGMRAVAEGVEDEDQRATLADLGCEVGQGFLYSTPQPAEIVTGLLVQRTLDADNRPEPYTPAAWARPGMVAPTPRSG
ncbi:MAG: bifunctional diguanylate cyclase/phosphodiesterase [Acidimicrobiia bacterium]|nr:bifunctional diguanylate cyclase/phosphodiesterase [Acidimicrobiia bacterium]